LSFNDEGLKSNFLFSCSAIVKLEGLGTSFANCKNLVRLVLSVW